jgi:heat shock protein HslJ
MRQVLVYYCSHNVRMKKYLLIGGLFIVLAGAAGAGYWFFLHEEEKPPRYQRDPNAWTVPPVAHPMKGKTFVVPEMENTTVTLDLIFPATKHDYPMGRFTLATGTGEGQLYAIDEWATPLENGLRAVPIVVTGPGTGNFTYLAIIEETDTTFTHKNSLYLGDRIRITNVSRTGNEVIVAYGVHAHNQPMAEIPSISTTAIIDIGSSTFVQEGRKPWIEATQVAKSFTGKYLWQKTTASDGTVVTPSVANTFSLLFDGPRITLGTDCNTGSSEITLPTGTSTAMSFGAVASTKKFCESSEEGPYFDMIMAVREYAEDDDGTLTFTLSDGREMVFAKEGQVLEFETDTNGDSPAP